MKSINEIIENWKEWETFLDDRFGKRLCDFLTVEQAEKSDGNLTKGTSTLRKNGVRRIFLNSSIRM